MFVPTRRLMGSSLARSAVCCGLVCSGLHCPLNVSECPGRNLGHQHLPRCGLVSRPCPFAPRASPATLLDGRLDSLAVVGVCPCEAGNRPLDDLISCDLSQAGGNVVDEPVLGVLGQEPVERAGLREVIPVVLVPYIAARRSACEGAVEQPTIRTLRRPERTGPFSCRTST
jgi:hypothetical protein